MLKLFPNDNFLLWLPFGSSIPFSKVWGITSSKEQNLQLGAHCQWGNIEKTRVLPFSFVSDFQGKNISSPHGMSKVTRNRKIEWTLEREDGSPRWSHKMWRSPELFQFPTLKNNVFRPWEKVIMGSPNNYLFITWGIMENTRGIRRLETVEYSNFQKEKPELEKF